MRALELVGFEGPASLQVGERHETPPSPGEVRIRFRNMALNHLARITARLIECGRPRQEPVAIISRATTPAQRVLVTSLEEAAAAAEAARIEAPTIIVIGEVVRLRATLDWLGPPP